MRITEGQKLILAMVAYFVCGTIAITTVLRWVASALVLNGVKLP